MTEDRVLKPFEVFVALSSSGYIVCCRRCSISTLPEHFEVNAWIDWNDYNCRFPIHGLWLGGPQPFEWTGQKEQR